MTIHFNTTRKPSTNPYRSWAVFPGITGEQFCWLYESMGGGFQDKINRVARLLECVRSGRAGVIDGIDADAEAMSDELVWWWEVYSWRVSRWLFRKAMRRGYLRAIEDCVRICEGSDCESQIEREIRAL